MTVTLALTPEQEKRLQMAAHRRGLDTNHLLHEFVEAALAQLTVSEPLETELLEAVPRDPILGQPAIRIPDLHAGQTWVSDDFDAPLPDSFWLGEE